MLPRSTAEIAAVLRLCNAGGAVIIPHGGGTGVVAGKRSIASVNAIILSLERGNRVRASSVGDRAMAVEAGCFPGKVHLAAQGRGLMFPPGMAWKGRRTIGGNLATNAGGSQVTRQGSAISASESRRCGEGFCGLHRMSLRMS